MLIPQGAVQGQPHQLAIIVVDDGNRVIKGISCTDAATDCLLQCFQVVVNLDLFRVLPRRNLQYGKSVFFHSVLPQSMQIQVSASSSTISVTLAVSRYFWMANISLMVRGANLPSSV